MPTEQNGVFTYGQEEWEIPEALAGISFEGIRFPDGIEQVEIDGRKTWISATREDRLAAETRRLGKAPDSLPNSCGLTDPTQLT